MSREPAVRAGLPLVRRLVQPADPVGLEVALRQQLLRAQLPVSVPVPAGLDDLGVYGLQGVADAGLLPRTHRAARALEGPVGYVGLPFVIVPAWSILAEPPHLGTRVVHVSTEVTELQRHASQVCTIRQQPGCSNSQLTLRGEPVVQSSGVRLPFLVGCH